MSWANSAVEGCRCDLLAGFWTPVHGLFLKHYRDTPQRPLRRIAGINYSWGLLERQGAQAALVLPYVGRLAAEARAARRSESVKEWAAHAAAELGL